MMYEFKKGEFNKLNNFNQDMKYIFSRYSLYNGIVIGDQIPSNGQHYVKYEYCMPGLRDSVVITFDPSVIFNTQKEYKKNITGYIVENEDLFLTLTDVPSPNDKIKIGTVVDANGIAAIKTIQAMEKAKELSKISGPFIQLSVIEMEQLLDFKTKIVVERDKFKTYITKDILPNVKKTDCVDVSFSETSNPGVFDVIIRIHRGGAMMSIHNYKCVYMKR